MQKSSVDYTLATNVITFLSAAIPQTGDTLLAWYRSDGSNAGGDLTGTYPNPVVAGIRGAVVSPSALSDGECLVWTSSSSQWEPKACAKATQSLQWHFAGTPTTGTQPMTLLIPEGVAAASLSNSRIAVNTTGGQTDFNIERCTSNCTTSSAVFSSVYASDIALVLGDRTVAGGTPTSTTANAGDQFRVSFSTVGSGMADVTVSLTYEYTAAH